MLRGEEQFEWTEALFNAFSYEEFSELIWHRLGERIDAYAGGHKNPKGKVADVVDAFSRRDWEFKLIAKAIEARPSNVALLRLARDKSATAIPDDASLERLIKLTSSFLEIGPWLEKAGRLQVCVCRIEITAQGGGTIFGSGFLVGPDLVMTNFHVVQPVVALEDGIPAYKGPLANAADVSCRFDYKVLANGAMNHGAKFPLAKEWRVALSPNSVVSREPTKAELDYAILRLQKPAGTLPVGDNSQVLGPGDQRGWIVLPTKGTRAEFKAHSPLFIIQHPSGEALKLALESDAIEMVDANRTRVRYRTNSAPGSSGSPCFDQNWNLLALHHSGDPNFAPDHAPTYNEGIPIDAIVDDLVAKGIPGLWN